MAAALALVFLFASGSFAADKPKQFPLRLVVLGSSEFTESRPLKKSLCITSGMGAPCVGDDQKPARDVFVVEVTGRITQRGRTTEYIVRCESRLFRRGPCREIKPNTYPARWEGERLQVLVQENPRKSIVFTFKVKAARPLDP